MAFGVPSFDSHNEVVLDSEWKKTLRKQAFGPGLMLIIVGAVLCALGFSLSAEHDNEDEDDMLGANLGSTGITLMVVGILGLIGGFVFWRSLSKSINQQLTSSTTEGHDNPVVVEVFSQIISQSQPEVVVPPPDYNTVVTVDMEELPSYDVAMQLQQQEIRDQEVRIQEKASGNDRL